MSMLHDYRREKWKKIQELIEKTKTEKVRDKTVPWYKLWARKIKKYGELTVKECPEEKEAYSIYDR